MKKKLFLTFLFSGAFFSGILFNLYTVSCVSTGTSVIQTNFSIPFEDFSCRNSTSGREISVSQKKSWGRESERVCIRKKILSRHRKKEGWSENSIRIRLKFMLSCQREAAAENLQKTEEKICAGDYFLYQIPGKYSLGENFKSGEIRRGNHPILRYHRIEKKGREILVFTFTEYAILYSYFGEVSGYMTLNLVS